MVLAELAEFALTLTIAIVVLVPFLVMLIVLLRFGGPWFRAYMSGTPVSLFDILGMRLRRTDVNAVLNALIMARQGGVYLSCRQVERAYLQRVDLEKLALAMVQAKKQGMDVNWEELVELEREHRLADKFKPQGPAF